MLVGEVTPPQLVRAFEEAYLSRGLHALDVAYLVMNGYPVAADHPAVQGFRRSHERLDLLAQELAAPRVCGDLCGDLG